MKKIVSNTMLAGGNFEQEIIHGSIVPFGLRMNKRFYEGEI
nr:hypothetical protein [uncultured Carboxylicivirga sp.]